MTNQELKRIAWLWAAAAFFVIMQLLTSCVTPEKGMRALDKDQAKSIDYAKQKLRNNPAHAAELCNDMYPIIEKKDDKAYQDSLAKLDSLVKEAKAQLEANESETEVLKDELKQMEYAAPPSCDSIRDAAAAVIKKQDKTIADLKTQVNQLKKQASTLPPVDHYQKSTAEIAAMDNALDKCQQNNIALSNMNLKTSQDRDTWKKKAEAFDGKMAVSKWLFWLIVGATGYFLASNFISKLNPINWLRKK